MTHHPSAASLRLHGARLLFPPVATLLFLVLTEYIARGALSGDTFVQYIFPHAEAYLLAWGLLFLVWMAVDWLTRFAPLATLLSALLGCLPATVDFYILQLRGEPFLPWDLMQVSEAAGVASAAGIHVQKSMVVSGVVVLALTVGSFFLYRGRQKLPWVQRLAGFAASTAAACALIFGVFLQPAVTQSLGILPDAWMQDRYYRYYGVITSFLTNLTNLEIDKPEAYSEEAINAILDDVEAGEKYTTSPVYPGSYAAQTPADEQVKQPTILYVMDESYWDVSELEQYGFQFDTDVSANLHALQQTSAYGRVYSPSFGGGTCDVEFEALTGYSVSYLPSGSKPYQQHVTKPMFALPSYLKTEGYQTAAVHCFWARYWSRDTAYPNLGLDDFISLEKMHGVQKVRRHYWTTGLVTDDSMADQIKKIMILGGGPNRIGQGIEFDYTCVHAAFTLRDHGYESIMVNCNPETVSTDFDTANKLYFEPVTVEDVLAIYEKEKPEGVIVQFGGQTPLNIAQALKDAGVKIMGTQPEGIRLAEDREYFRERMIALNIRQPESGTARSLEEAVELGRRIGYPVMVRPSFVLGGRGMEVIYDEENLKRYGVEAIQVSPEYPMLIDRFLDNAIEAEVDALADGTDTFVATVMEHIELAGIHSGDSACAIPPVTIAPKHIRTIEEHAAKIAQDFQVKGILNVQFAICNDEVYIIEANPRASRTVPIVSKVTGISLARYATEIMLGKKLKELGLKSRACRFIGVKEAVFPFNMFPEVDPVLGPEMRATGEVMGIADNFGMAYYKAQEAAGCILPTAGKVLVTVSDRDKKFIEPIARDLISLGFTIVSTGGTAEYLRGQGVETEVVNKLHEGRPNLGDMITNKQIDLIINTPVDRTSMIDDSFIRMQSIQKKIPYMTTIAAARATVEGIRSAQHVKVSPRSLQEYHS